MQKDYYKILGVGKESSEKEIKSVFRKLAKKYHPDTNQGNTEAEARFKEINEAYNVLGDSKKREMYDKYGDMAFQEGFDPKAYEAYRSQSGGYNQSWNMGGGGFQNINIDDLDIDDLLSGLFGTRRQTGNGFGSFSGMNIKTRGADLTAEISISFDEAAKGCDKILKLEDAEGSQSSIQVHIPAGIDENQKVRLRGKGEPGISGGENGDLFISVHIKPKRGFERKGQDVYVTARIPYATAVLGGEAIVPTLNGNVICKIKAGTQSGSKIRLKGKGIVSMKNPSSYGDEYIVVQIDVPKKLSEEQKEKLKEFQNSLDGSHINSKSA